MKLSKLIPLLFALWAFPLLAQNPGTFMPSCRASFTFTTTGRGPTIAQPTGNVTGYNNITPTGSVNTHCAGWTLSYAAFGFSALSIEVDSAPDASATSVGTTPGSWTIWPAANVAAGQTLPLTSTSNAAATVFGFFPWVSINVTTATCPAATVCQGVAFLYGWQVQGSQESNTGATQSQGVTPPGSVPNGNPIQTALNAPTKPWDCALTGLAAALTQCQAAPAAGRLYITDITVDTTTATAGTYLIEYGTGANCATGTTKLYPSTNGPAGWTAPVLGAPQKINFTVPLQPVALNAICVLGTATNTINIELEGFIAP